MRLIMQIQFNNFKAIDESIRIEIREQTVNVLDSGWYILGKQVKSFERAFANYLGIKHTIGVASGTEAIALCLMAYDIGVGDEVITTDMTAFPTITGIIMTGATPVIVDIDDGTGLISTDMILNNITPKTKAIVPVHLYGQPADMGKIMRIALQHNIRVVEDCAQSCGSEWQSKKCGTIGDIAAFSFYPTKNLGAVGDGGAIATNDDIIYEKLLKLRNYGQSDRYHHEIYGINSRLDEIQAAILKVKLKYLDYWNEKRNQIASYYSENIKNDKIIFLHKKDVYHNYHLFVIKCKARANLQDFLKNSGIATLIHYPVPCRKQMVMKKFRREAFETKWRSDGFADTILSLPIYPELTEKETQYIIDKLNSA